MEVTKLMELVKFMSEQQYKLLRRFTDDGKKLIVYDPNDDYRCIEKIYKWCSDNEVEVLRRGIGEDEVLTPNLARALDKNYPNIGILSPIQYILIKV